MITTNIKKVADECSKCGKCRTVCPSYRELKEETMLARGRIHLATIADEKKLEASQELKDIFTNCLLCLKCRTVCPNDVDIETIIINSRNQILNKVGRSFIESFIMKFIVSRKRPLYLGASMMGISNSIINKFHLTAPFRQLLTTLDIKKERLLPEFKVKSFSSNHKTIISKKGNSKKVLYFPGCSANLVLSNIGDAVIKTLINNDTDVIVSQAGCCGLPIYVSGDFKTAQKQALKTFTKLKEEGCDTIVTSCGSCGHMVKNIYKEMFENNGYDFNVMDISEYLININFKAGKNNIEKNVTYHDPCHLKRAMNISKEPRKLLKSIPGVSYIELPNSDDCCGSGGSFSLKFYDTSKKILKRKVNSFTSTNADILATGCPACILHIQDGFHSEKIEKEVIHPVELLAITYDDE